MPYMSLYQKMLVLCGDGRYHGNHHRFLSRDKKRIRFLSAVLVGATADEFSRRVNVLSLLMTA